jgi:hypothetical protein
VNSLPNPSSVYVDTTGNAFIADSSRAIWKLNTNNNIMTHMRVASIMGLMVITFPRLLRASVPLILKGARWEIFMLLILRISHSKN